MTARINQVLSFGVDQWDPTHRFETSWLLPPWALLACRAIFSLYAFTTLLFSIAWYCTHDGCDTSGRLFSYFTHLTYWGIAFYLLTACVHTATYIFDARRRPLLDCFPRPLQTLHSLYYTTICVFPLLVTIVYWSILYGETTATTTFRTWSDISVHAMNSGFTLFEMLVPRMAPPPPVHMLWLVIILALYLALAYVTRATKGFYVYSFLGPQEAGDGMVAAYVFGVLIACLVLFGLVWAIIALRQWLTETRLGMHGKLAKPHEAASRLEERKEMHNVV